MKISLSRNQIAGIIGIAALTLSFVFPSVAPIISGLSNGLQTGFVDLPDSNIQVNPDGLHFGCSRQPKAVNNVIN